MERKHYGLGKVNRLKCYIFHNQSVIINYINYMQNSFRYRWTVGKWIIQTNCKAATNSKHSHLQSVWTTTRQVMAITRTLQTEDEYQGSRYYTVPK